jgi:hypothetical protein
VKMATKGGPIRGQDLVAVRGTCRPKDGQNLAQFPDPVPQHLPLLSRRRKSDKQLPDLPMTARCASATNPVEPGTASVIPPRLTQIVNGLKRPDMADVRTVTRSIVWGSWFV